jgi:DNA repair protein RadC
MTAIYEFTSQRRRVGEGPKVKTPADVAVKAQELIGSKAKEHLIVFMLTTRNEIMGFETVYIGNVAGSPVRVGEVFREAIVQHAAAIIVAHNHPSGDLTASGDDLRITTDLQDAGRLLDIDLLDHVIVSDAGFKSMRAEGVL